jgi:hypothetical protein
MKLQRLGYYRRMASWRVGFVLVVLLVSCTKPNPAATCLNGACADPAYPFFDLDGAVAGEPNKCIAVTCTPGAFATCRGTDAIVCNSAGDNYNDTMCAGGCSPANGGCNQCVPGTDRCNANAVEHCGTDGKWMTKDACQIACVETPIPRCPYLQPRYLPDVCDVPATSGNLTITNSGRFDVEFDANCTGGVVMQPGGPSICVVRYGAITVSSGRTLTIVSSASPSTSRAIALVADGPINISGVIDLGAVNVEDGPGGGAVQSGGLGSAQGKMGCGGAGFKTAGAPGGSATTDGGAGNGGVATIDPSLVTPLTGGPRSAAGGGGGAMTLISCRDAVLVSGIVSAGGGGGLGGIVFGGVASQGCGGGAGGYVVMQGMNVKVIGELYANGGGGGAGTSLSATTRHDGSDGSRSDAVAASGGASEAGTGRGGDGGLVNAIPQGGAHPTTSGANAGGGGGSIGFFQSYTPAGVTPTLTPAHASPAFQPNGTIPTR